MCTALGLTVGGTKGQLQAKLTAHLNMLLSRHDSVKYNLAKSSAEIQRGSAYGARVEYVTGDGRKIDFSRPNGYHASTTPSSSLTPAQTSSNPKTWGMSSLYQNVRLRIYPFCSFLTNSRLQETSVL